MHLHDTYVSCVPYYHCLHIKDTIKFPKYFFNWSIITGRASCCAARSIQPSTPKSQSQSQQRCWTTSTLATSRGPKIHRSTKKFQLLQSSCVPKKIAMSNKTGPVLSAAWKTVLTFSLPIIQGWLVRVTSSEGVPRTTHISFYRAVKNEKWYVQSFIIHIDKLSINLR